MGKTFFLQINHPKSLGNAMIKEFENLLVCTNIYLKRIFLILAIALFKCLITDIHKH